MSTTESQNPILWILIAIAAIVLLGPLLLMLFAVPMMGGWMMSGPGFGGTGLGPVWGVVWMLVPLTVLVGLGYLGYRALQGVGGIGSDRALEELRLAYARGDVSEEEYERRREQLERDRER